MPTAATYKFNCVFQTISLRLRDDDYRAQVPFVTTNIHCVIIQKYFNSRIARKINVSMPIQCQLCRWFLVLCYIYVRVGFVLLIVNWLPCFTTVALNRTRKFICIEHRNSSNSVDWLSYIRNAFNLEYWGDLYRWPDRYQTWKCRNRLWLKGSVAFA